jgi:nucleotide-binding universal stress UspA family protein
MKRVLIPVDFSQGSLNSCKYAVEIATKAEPVTLWLFHVYADQMLYMPTADPDSMMTDPVISTEFSEEIKKIAENNMAHLKEEVEHYIKERNYTNFTVNKFLVSGDPEWMVEDICKELDTDGIIMSTSGTGNKGPLEGSMAMKIMGKAPVPVIAVPYQYTKYRFNNVLYATKLDNDAHDISAIKKLLELFKHHNFTIFVTHFRKSDKETVTMEVLENTFEKERLKEKIRFMIVNDADHESTINTVTTNNDIDLIAFIAHPTHPLKLLFSRGIHKDDFISAQLPVFGLPPVKD